MVALHPIPYGLQFPMTQRTERRKILYQIKHKRFNDLDSINVVFFKKLQLILRFSTQNKQSNRSTTSYLNLCWPIQSISFKTELYSVSNWLGSQMIWFLSSLMTKKGKINHAVSSCKIQKTKTQCFCFASMSNYLMVNYIFEK